MRATDLAVGALPDDLSTVHDHRADHRIGTGMAPALRSEAKGQSHEFTIAGRYVHRVVRLDRRTTRLAAGRFFAWAGFADFLADFTAPGFVAFGVLFAGFGFDLGFSFSASANAACAAANRAIPTR